MWKHLAKATLLITLALGASGCFDPSVKAAKTETKNFETKIAADDWKAAGNMMDPSFVWTKADGSSIKPPSDARIAWLTAMKATGSRVTYTVEDSSKPDDSTVVVKTKVQVRTGDSTKPSNIFWSCSIKWKKIKDTWKIVAITDLSPRETKSS